MILLLSRRRRSGFVRTWPRCAGGKVERLHEASADPGLRDEALGMLRGLRERVVVHPAEDGLQVEIV